ncbi:uncharacterized protein TRAVEDRAFT_36912 [Trametes versicolor FP-101664 SS1]|uniref:uncharacterized protein n=1 Tax=Trametes versicolor (strain FP-101664) TaxID=717944 RepID=UPI0004622CA3|nr:uncharacterized protein TRAVEDRAFT_36912 [Trametes versicolor FP-101664 SS1]EIW59529.1 hypothetical protein TRAVEDRAFT_36912 [Trametes versicolor FP-101664 SS1]
MALPLHDSGPIELDTEEQAWLAHQPFLYSRGYQLRPRYRPNWVPSWTPGFHYDAEDALLLPFRGGVVIDATRISDGKMVYIKKVRRGSEELAIATYLYSEESRGDAQNRCVPILDVLDPPQDPTISLMVMPFLRYIDSPKFERVEDILQCGRQLLEGLVFLHAHDVAHRDCSFKNLMMDASALHPLGHHPIQYDYLASDYSQRAPVLSRVVARVKYYFTDFGISTRFAPGAENRLVLGDKGLDKELPELSLVVPYDPFKADVFLLGNVFRKHFVEKYRNAPMLDMGQLVARMTAPDPKQRPTAAGALREWQALQKRTSAVSRGWRLQPQDDSESLLVRVIYDVVQPYHSVVPKC